MKTDLWIIRPKPYPDELLSSWLVRIAFRTGLKLQTFSRLHFGHRPIWNRDIDKSADPEFLKILSEGTGTPPDTVFKTTLKAYEGSVYLQHNSYGNTQWILPLGIYHRVRRGYGLQFCPHCLAESNEPYFRRRWRLSFVVACAKHGNVLADRCSACEAPVCFHRRDIGNRSDLPDGAADRCFSCNYDLRNTPVASIPEEEMTFHRSLDEGVERGYLTAPDGSSVYAHLYLDVLHQIMKLIISRRSRDLGTVLSHASGLEAVEIPSHHTEIEHLTIEDRRRLLMQARWILSEWPDRFLRVCKDNEIWSTWLLRDMIDVPWWFASIIEQELTIKYAPFNKDYDRKTRRYRKGT